MSVKFFDVQNSWQPTKYSAIDLPAFDSVPSGDTLTSWTVNAVWRKVIADALTTLLNPNVWSGSDVQIEDAQFEVVRLIDALYGDVQVAGVIGEIMFYAGLSLPPDFLDADGTLRSRFDFPELFDVIGYQYGGSDDNFNMPDLRHRTVVGYHGGFAPFNTIGADVGELEHTLTVAEMPAHSHVILRSVAGGNQPRVPAGVTTASTSTSTQSSGGDEPHNNVQPSRVFRALIRYRL